MHRRRKYCNIIWCTHRLDCICTRAIVHLSSKGLTWFLLFVLLRLRFLGHRLHRSCTASRHPAPVFALHMHSLYTACYFAAFCRVPNMVPRCFSLRWGAATCHRCLIPRVTPCVAPSFTRSRGAWESYAVQLRPPPWLCNGRTTETYHHHYYYYYYYY